MNLWSDGLNYPFDGMMHHVTMALGIGVEPADYVLLVSITRMMQSLRHSKMRIHSSLMNDAVMISPWFHRWHHATGIGHDSKSKSTLGDHNFGVLFSFWDSLFRTAYFGKTFEHTGWHDRVAMANRPAGAFGHSSGWD